MPREKKKESKEIKISKPTNNHSARTLMWLGVIIFSLIIILLWGWALKIQLSSLSWQKTPESQLLKTGQNNWDSLFNATEEKLKIDAMKLQLKNALNKIMSNTSTDTTNTESNSINALNSTSTSSTNF